jgi:hypothetical protein
MEEKNFGVICKNKSCLDNVAKFIHNYNKLIPLDFIGLQEASEWEKIFLRANLSHMVPINHGLSLEKQVIFCDKNKYDLVPGVCIIRSYMENKDRPFTIVFLTHKATGNKICLINMHPGHHKDFEKFEVHLEKTLSGEKDSYYSTSFGSKVRFDGSRDVINDIINKLNNYDIIMMGDMNMKPPNPYIFLPKLLIPGKILYGGESSDNTCCDQSLQGQASMSYDHVMSSSQNISHYIPKVINASDHLPNITQINFPQC